ncbi:MAG: DsrE family protein [Promethearchaeota archaeon]
MTKKLVYLLTAGPETPERLYAPFILATTAKMMDIDATIFFMIHGVKVVKKGEADSIKISNFPPLKEVIDQAIKAGVELMVCDQSTQLLGLDRGGYLEGAKVVGAATLNDLALEADGLLVF